MRRSFSRPHEKGGLAEHARWYRRTVGRAVAAEILLASLFISFHDYEYQTPDESAWIIGVAEKVTKFKIFGHQNAWVTLTFCSENATYVKQLEEAPTAEGYKATIDAVENCHGRQGGALLTDLKEVPKPGRVILINNAAASHNIMYDSCATATIESKGSIVGCHESG